MRKELEQTYRAAEYCLWLANQEHILRIGTPAPAALKVLQQLGLQKAAYIVTPCNPRSEQLSNTDNRARLERLRTQMKATKLRWLPCVNRDPKREWPDEPGALILDCDVSFAERLARDYEQNAFVEFNLDGVPVLINA